MPGHYILIGQTPVPCEDVLEWGRWLQTANRRVRLTRVGPYFVSTVFLGLDHSFGAMFGREAGPPILFETMVYIENPRDVEFAAVPEYGIEAQTVHFVSDFLDIQERCSTWLEAEAQHAKIVVEVGQLHDDVEEIDPKDPAKVVEEELKEANGKS